MNKNFQIAHTAAELLAQARATTGIDIVDADIQQRLEKFVHALNTEARLNEAGAKAMAWHIEHVLCDRLRMLRDFRAHPEIAEQRIVRPLILSGAARTGSTKLHKMLAASGDFQWLPCWQGVSLSLLSGDRSEDPAERIRVATEHIGWFNEHSPKARLIHEFSTFEPEEENLILAHLFFGPYMWAFAFVPEYIQWYMTNVDIPADLHYLKRSMQYLQWQFHDGDARPWVLKNPIWPGLEPLLAQVFPDAAFASTHREPVGVMSSSLSLLYHYHLAYSDAESKGVLGPVVLEGLGQARDVQVASREAHPEIDMLDIAYSATTKNAEAVVEKLYVHAGMTLTDRARENMRQWERDNAQHKLGVHQHALEEFGVTAEMVKERFSKYNARYGAYF